MVEQTPDCQTIQEGIDMAARLLPVNPTILDSVTVLVLPGAYYENVICRPFVNVQGLSQPSTYLFTGNADPLLPAITLDSSMNVANLSILMPAGVSEADPAAIVGGDYKQNIHSIGLTNINVFPFDDGTGVRSMQRSLELRNCSQALFTSLGVSYYGHTDRHCIEVHGPDSVDVKIAQESGWQGYGSTGWNADTHFIDCFVDALEQNDSAGGGCFLTEDCYEVHVRGSLLRTGGHGAAVRVARTVQHFDYENLTMVLVEGSTLYGTAGSPRALSIGAGTQCIFNHSTTDSVWVPPAPAPYVFKRA